ncbi:MAG: hypothetical protein OEV78_02185 [Spirochaetia bacterium]|nr:hypothetical protein [Spirochaetia bacterium]
MMKKVILISTILVFSAINCKEKSADSNSYMGQMANDPKLSENNITKLVRVDDLHVAFDFMSMPYHMQMMKLMHADMKHVEGATHGLMITVMDYHTKKIIKEAQVLLSITDPTGKVSQYESEIISGAGMHHYAAHLTASQQGKYLIIANIKYRGKTYIAKTEFSNQ